MKKIFLLTLLAGCCALAAAQPKAVGLRSGLSGDRLVVEVSYEHAMGFVKGDFIEAEVGLYGRDGFRTTGIYNLTFLAPDWSSRGDWEFYGGLGVELGYGAIIDDSSPASISGMPLFAPCAQLGVAYTFAFPLQLSLDFRPSYALPIVFNQQLGWLSWGVGVHYAF